MTIDGSILSTLEQNCFIKFSYQSAAAESQFLERTIIIREKIQWWFIFIALNNMEMINDS